MPRAKTTTTTTTKTRRSKATSTEVAHNPTVHPEALKDFLGQMKTTRPPASVVRMDLTAANGLAFMASNTRNKNLNLPHAAGLGQAMRSAAAGIDPAHGLEDQPYISGVTLTCIAKGDKDSAGLDFATDGQHNNAGAILAEGTREQWEALARYLGYTSPVKVTEENQENHPGAEIGDTRHILDWDKFVKTVGFEPLPAKTEYRKDGSVKTLGRDHYRSHSPWVLLNIDAHPLSFLVKNGAGQLKATAGSFLQREPETAAELARVSLDSDLAASICRFVRLRTTPGINYKDTDGDQARYGSISKGGASGSPAKVMADWKKYRSYILEGWTRWVDAGFPNDSLGRKVGPQFVVTALALGLAGAGKALKEGEPDHVLWDQDTVAAGMDALHLDSVGKVKPNEQQSTATHLLAELTRVRTVDGEPRPAPRRMKAAEVLAAIVEILSTGDGVEMTTREFHEYYVAAALPTDHSGTSYNPEQIAELRWVGPDSTLSISNRTAKKG